MCILIIYDYNIISLTTTWTGYKLQKFWKKFIQSTRFARLVNWVAGGFSMDCIKKIKD